MLFRERTLACVTLLALTGCARDVIPALPVPDHRTDAAATGCPFETAAPGESARSVLLVTTGTSLTTIQSDRTSRSLYTFGAGLGLPDASITITEPETRDGFVAAHALLDAPGGVQHEVVLLGPSGAVLWHTVYPQTTNASLYLGANGALAVDTNEGTLDRLGNWFLGTGAIVHNVHGYSPVAAAAPNGEIPVRRGTQVHPTPADYGWFDATNGMFRPLSHPLDPNDALIGLTPRWIADRLVYRTREGGALALVSESIDGTSHVIPLSSAAGDIYGPTIADASDNGWVLLARSRDDVHYRVNVQTGSIEELVALRAPPRTAGSAWVGDAHIGDDGLLLQGAASTTGSQMFFSDDVGAAWAALGDPVPFSSVPRNADNGRGMSGVARGGTTLVLTTDMLGFRSVELPPQVVRVADRIHEDLPAPPTGFVPRLSPDGLCVAYWDTSDRQSTMHALDVRSGRRFDLAVRGTLGEASWMH